jgi:hypothetical protein
MKTAIARIEDATRRLHQKKTTAGDAQVQRIAGCGEAAGGEVSAAATKNSKIVDRGVQGIPRHNAASGQERAKGRVLPTISGGAKVRQIIRY